VNSRIEGAKHYAQVALEVPIADAFDYELTPQLVDQVVPGAWVEVPWGRSRRIGVVIALSTQTTLPVERIKCVTALVAGAPLPDPAWIGLARFVSGYYHRPIGEVLMPAIPKLLRRVPAPRRRATMLARPRPPAPAIAPTADLATVTASSLPRRVVSLQPQQQAALDALQAAQGFAVFVLHGVTGSGKTEVYLHWVAQRLAGSAQAQALILVPEIGLAPQITERVKRHFPGVPIALLHSDLPDGERAAAWLQAAEGRARIIIGTRLAVLTPMPGLAAIVVDEEHDPSYKQQEGVRYSARDLAVTLGSQRAIPVVLGSATPSLETWQAVNVGRYRLLAMPARAEGAQAPAIRVVDLRGLRAAHGLTPQAIAAMTAAMARGQQALVFINRRGFAPVLSCEACGWLSGCEACSAKRVLHRSTPARQTGAARFRLICHHCGSQRPVPRACPDCGNVDLQGLGQGTQRLEAALQAVFPQARIARLDRDVASRRGAAQTVLAAAHAGEIDLLVGTQMLAKGHDFRRLAVVVVVDADAALYSADFRAAERLFATLMQVAGRAGRSQITGSQAEVIVQTRFVSHPLFHALVAQDYAGFAARELAEREQAGLPPLTHQALLRAEARTCDEALRWLAWAREQALASLQTLGEQTPQVFDPVPVPMMRVAGIERAQLLLESPRRQALHRLLRAWLPKLRTGGANPAPGPATVLRWHLEVDPLEI
jgi:primosomal protein N' (replication factor Y) (superfamily II helicase)